MSKLTNVLLALVLVGLVTLIVLNVTERKADADYRAARREAVTALSAEYLREASVLLEDYQIAAYDSSDVDRIAEQQLIVDEFQLRAMQTLIIQGAQILELLAGE
jgi:hypothetical protein